MPACPFGAERKKARRRRMFTFTIVYSERKARRGHPMLAELRNFLIRCRTQ